MKKILVILLLLTFHIYAYGESIQTFRLDHISISDGLPNSSVSKIIQDKYGFMWFGTQSGVTRYDGYSFKTFLNDPFNDNSLPHNLVQTMYLDQDDILWLGTYNGLSRLDINTENFINFPSIFDDEKSLSNDVVVAIERDNQGRLWVGTLDGLNLLDEKTGTFKKYFNDPENELSLPNNVVRTILLDDNNNLWIGTYGGLSLFDEENDSFINYAPLENDPLSIPNQYVMDLKQSPTSSDKILIGSWGGGVTEFDTITKKAITYEIPDKRVYTMLSDKQNRIWAGTWGGGLSVLDLSDGSYNQFKQGTSSDLSHNIIYSLCQDLSGVVWIGTNGGGINKYVGWKNQYKFLKNDPKNPNSLPVGKVQVAYEDSENRLWFGIDGFGLSRYIKETDDFINYTYDENNQNSISNNTINTIYEDSSKNLWIGTNNGLNRYLEEFDEFQRSYLGESVEDLTDNLVYSIVEDFDKNLWFGTYTKGITVYNPKTNRYKNYRNDKKDPDSLSDNLIRNMTVDSNGNIWIATNKGLNIFQKETETFKKYFHDTQNLESLSSNDVRKIFEDSEEDIWIGTNGGGVNLFNKDIDSFIHFTVIDGLINNSIKGIEEDDNGNILFITEAGISVYNKIEKSFSIIDEKTGLLSSELTSGYIKTIDNSFYIGSNNGITFIPNIQKQNYSYTPMIHINKFSVLGIPYNSNSHSNPIWKEKGIILKAEENILAFEFALSDYSSEGQNQFAYFMEGVDSSWVYSGVRNFARYTQLDPGEYIFRVIGADSRNNWNNTGISLKITILPPFWLSRFAYISYIIIFFLLIILVILRIKRKNLEQLEKIEEQKALNLELENRVRIRTSQIEESRKVAETATKAKSLFLANMSHELRTPLNAVVGFSALLDETDSSTENKHIISSIKAAGKTLSTLINDLLDLSKLEAGKISIFNSPVNLNIVLFEIKHIFELKIKEKNLTFHIDQNNDLSKELMIDETKLRQILINLTGNAIKFTNTGFVKISIRQIDNPKEGFIDLQLSIEDSGIGLRDQEKERVFELFWQSEHNNNNNTTGTGLGLSITKNLVQLMNGEITVKSILGEGSIFTIIFHDVAVSVTDYIETNYSNIDITNVLTNELSDIDYNSDFVLNLDELLSILEKYEIEWKDLKPSGRMSILENFGLRLKDLGKKHNANGLTVYAEDLLTCIKQFDLTKLENELKRFPSIIERLKA